MTGSLRLSISGAASAPSIGAVDARIVLEPDTVTVRDVPFEIRAAEVRIKDGRATVENLELTAPGTTASVSGSSTDGQASPRRRRVGLRALGFCRRSSRPPGGAFKASLKLTGPAADPSVTGKVSSTTLPGSGRSSASRSGTWSAKPS